MEAAPGLSLFDCAETLGVRVPTSCHKQGKCRECLVEVTQGSEFLSPPVAAEKHLSGAFRLSCRTLLQGDNGHVRCHTMRRGAMRIERNAAGLSFRGVAFDPAVTRDGDRIPSMTSRSTAGAARSTDSRWTWARPRSSCASSTSKPAN